MRISRIAGLPVALLLIFAPPAESQVLWGGHVARAGDTFGGVDGIGARLGLSAPMVPLDLVASGEYFFPECPPGFGDCGLRGAGVDLNWRLMVPVVRPYVSGGMVWRQLDPGGASDVVTESGLAVGGGVDVALGGVRLFGEARYEMVDAPSSQTVFRLGVQTRVP